MEIFEPDMDEFVSTVSPGVSTNVVCDDTSLEPFPGSSSEYEPNDSSPDRKFNKSFNTTPEKILRRKRPQPSEWRKNKAKSLKTEGKEYVNRAGDVKKAKELKKSCGESCRMKCTQRVSEECRMQIFNKFYNICNQDLQWAYISNLITLCEKKVVKNIVNSRKTESRKYFLPILKDEKEMRETVCKTMFLNTLSISHTTVDTVVRKMHSNGGSISPDRRGTLNKINEKVAGIREIIKEHVNSFPLVDSHYCRQHSRKMYIDGDITSVAQMYRLYEQWFDENGYKPDNKVTLRQYRDTFHESFNLLFYIPKKDQCDICEKYKNSNEHEKKIIESDFNHHLFCKVKSRELKAIDKNESLNNPNVSTICFDFQKILSSPCAEVSTFYYKRKLHAYNFTTFELNTQQASCFVWDETTAKRGAIEVASCLFRFISTKTEKSGTNKYNFWSDNCGGQNKNKIVFSIYVWISQKLNIDISHKFLEKGHTQNEGDSVHALIEKTKKHKRIYTPMEWFSVIRNAKKTEPMYNVIEMETDDFLDFKKFSSFTNWTKNTKNEKFNLNKMREIRVYKENKYKLYYKYEFDEDFKEILLYDETKRRRKEKLLPQFIPKAYSSPFPIAEEKRKDLIDLCDKNLIPKIYKNFYMQLKGTEGCAYVVTSDTE